MSGDSMEDAICDTPTSDSKYLKTKCVLKYGVLPLTLVFVYNSATAAVFQFIEEPYEINGIRLIREHRQDFLIFLWTTARSDNISFINWTVMSEKRVLEYDALKTAHLQTSFPIYGTEKDRLWTYWGAFLYAGTLYTTIGYGLIATKTMEGRVATLVFSTIGIPLFMLSMGYWGKLMALGLRKLHYLIWRAYKYAGVVGHVTAEVAECSAHQAAAKLHDSFHRHNTENLEQAQVASHGNTTEEVTNHDVVLHTAEPSRSGTLANSSDKDLSREQIHQKLKTEMAEKIENIPSEKDFKTSVVFPVILMILYIMAGALLFHSWEHWTFFDSFYFIFISFTTIGLGDMIPSRNDLLMASTPYVLFGLTLVSFTLNTINLSMAEVANKAPEKILSLSKRYKGRLKEHHQRFESAVDITDEEHHVANDNAESHL